MLQIFVSLQEDRSKTFKSKALTIFSNMPTFLKADTLKIFTLMAAPIGGADPQTELTKDRQTHAVDNSKVFLAPVNSSPLPFNKC
jgi:hypothetical protein